MHPPAEEPDPAPPAAAGTGLDTIALARDTGVEQGADFHP
jgi:hypothetical protein